MISHFRPNISSWRRFLPFGALLGVMLVLLGCSLSPSLQTAQQLNTLANGYLDYNRQLFADKAEAQTDVWIEPYSGAPHCPIHDDRQWHGLWDGRLGCHYNHTHNADPSGADNIFGPAGKMLDGQTISYPWETNHENHHKHEGYKYAVASGLPCVQDTYEYVAPKPGCVRSYRIQYHALGGSKDGLMRFHSYFAEVEVCTHNGERCGIIRSGGHSDIGVLHLPYRRIWMPVPDRDPEVLRGLDPAKNPEVVLGPDPYHAYNDLEAMLRQRVPESMCKNCNGASRELRVIWTTPTKHIRADWAETNQSISYKLWVFDDWGGFNREKLEDYQFVCPDYQCRFNNSEHSVFEVGVDIPAALDIDGDGLVSYRGFTDLKGNVATSCNTVSADCVPLSIENAPVGYHLYSFQQPNSDITQIQHDFDLSPAGVWWITYPN